MEEHRQAVAPSDGRCIRTAASEERVHDVERGDPVLGRERAK
jgi:hypothetical protein